jgi:hypothetical protein
MSLAPRGTPQGGVPHHEEITPRQARQAVKTGRARWILAVSLFLACVALGAALLWYVVIQPGGWF